MDIPFDNSCLNEVVGPMVERHKAANSFQIKKGVSQDLSGLLLKMIWAVQDSNL